MCFLQDTLRVTTLRDAASAKMNGLPNVLGDKYQEFLNTIERDTLQQLEEALRAA